MSEVNINTVRSLSAAHSLLKQTLSLRSPLPAHTFEVFQTSVISCPKEAAGTAPQTISAFFACTHTHTHTKCTVLRWYPVPGWETAGDKIEMRSVVEGLRWWTSLRAVQIYLLIMQTKNNFMMNNQNKVLSFLPFKLSKTSFSRLASKTTLTCFNSDRKICI